MNKYLIAYTKYKNYFSSKIDIATYCTEAENMKEAIKKAKENCSILDIISITKLEDNLDWKDLS